MAYELIGYAAGTLATLAFLPQVIKSIHARKTEDISLGMYSLFCSGVALWLLYGILLLSWPLIIANAITFILASIVLILKIKHG